MSKNIDELEKILLLHNIRVCMLKSDQLTSKEIISTEEFGKKLEIINLETITRIMSLLING